MKLFELACVMKESEGMIIIKQVMNRTERIRKIYLHNFMMYNSNKIDIDEFCIRLRTLDKLINESSPYYSKRDRELVLV